MPLVDLLFSPECHLNAPAAQSGGQTGRVVHTAQGSVTIAGGKAFVEQHQAVRAEQHQIPSLDLSRAAGVSGQTAVQIE